MKKRMICCTSILKVRGSRWVYGAGLHTSVELFLTDRIIVGGKAQLRYLFNSDVHRLRPMQGLGLRYQL